MNDETPLSPEDSTMLLPGLEALPLRMYNYLRGRTRQTTLLQMHTARPSHLL